LLATTQFLNEYNVSTVEISQSDLAEPEIYVYSLYEQHVSALTLESEIGQWFFLVALLLTKITTFDNGYGNSKAIV